MPLDSAAPFRVRLNCVDYYHSSPGDFDPPIPRQHDSAQQSSTPQVPIIRVFGSTETGQKVCAHIHGVFPYLFVQYDRDIELQEVNTYIQQLQSSINNALAVSYRCNTYDGKADFVALISLVKAVPFFGYHVGYRLYLKIYLFNPAHINRLSDLLLQGAVMNQSFQPFESHIQYISQWMCDYNLYGCAYIDCKEVKFREPVPDYEQNHNKIHSWHNKSVPSSMISDPLSFPRQSYCSIEVDIRVEEILNRAEIVPRALHHDLMEKYQASRLEDKLVKSLAGLWKDESRRRKLRMGLEDPSSSPFPPEVLSSMSADLRSEECGAWIHEQEYRQLIDNLIRTEKANSDYEHANDSVRFKHDRGYDSVQTALDSVADFYPEQIQKRQDEAIVSCSSKFGEDIVSRSTGTLGQLNAPKCNASELNYESNEALKWDNSSTNRSDALLETSVHSSEALIPNHKTFTKSDSIDGFADDNEQPCTTLDNKGLENESHKLNGSHVVLDRMMEITTSYANRSSDVIDSNKERKLVNTTSHKENSQGISQGKTAGENDHLTARCQCTCSNDTCEEMHVHDDEGQRLQAEPIAQIQVPSVIPSDVIPQSSIRFQIDEDQLVQGLLSRTEGQHQTERTRNITARDTMGNIVSEKQHSELCRHARITASISREDEANKRQYTVVTDARSSNIPNNMSQLCKLISKGFSGSSRSTYIWAKRSPGHLDLEEYSYANERLAIVYQDAFYSKERDVPEKPREFAGREFRLESDTIPYLPVFNSSIAQSSQTETSTAEDLINLKTRFSDKARFCQLRCWEYWKQPPTYSLIASWATGMLRARSERVRDCKEADDRQGGLPSVPGLSQIDAPTPKSKHDYESIRNKYTTSVRHETQYMSTMCLEVHVNTRGNLLPDPEFDDIACIFWCLKSDEVSSKRSNRTSAFREGILVVSDAEHIADQIRAETSAEIICEAAELDLINNLISLTRALDPDILTGYEVHNSSWGYLIERARLKYDYDLCDELSRTKSQSNGRFGRDADRWGFNHTSTIRITGRHMINMWRAMRGELNLLQYTIENVTFHLLHKRIPHYSFEILTTWFTSSNPSDLAKLIHYYVTRVRIDMEILEVNELIPRTSEQARLIGVDFFSVFSRGSQYKVESFMFRIAKPENYILVSPSRKQVGQQNALECLPLVLEPQSAFYKSPLLVLDFQSLYPSIMIAHNYCYSTCLGRVVSWRGQNKLGFTDFKRQPRLLELLSDAINIAPNGIMYVRPKIRQSLLAKMLSEILETRVMVKSGMNTDKDDKILQQLLNNRQLALKLLANVTYGYTSASFSGRMPCSEIADSIVQTGRETLEKAIAYIHSETKWNAEVVYGDTDSLFVHLRGRTKEEAFDIGNEIAKAITQRNPAPMKLKLEKVYLPSILLAKKRYVGFSYESKNQQEPKFDAKGIETVRRDGTPAEQKIEEAALKLLFKTSDLSQVKDYFQQQCAKIMQGKVSIQDFFFAREVKLGTYADKGPPPPGALVSTKRMLEDPRAEPQYGERIPYVVATGHPGARLIDRCISPAQLLSDEARELDSEYYILKNLIPPLERIFSLVGANVRQWYEEMPKFLRTRDLQALMLFDELASITGAAGSVFNGRKTLESYMGLSQCLVCRQPLDTQPASLDVQDLESQEPIITLSLCTACQNESTSSLYAIRQRLRRSYEAAAQLDTICRCCANLTPQDDVKCDSKDCPVFYSRIKSKVKVETHSRSISEIASILEDKEMEDNLKW